LTQFENDTFTSYVAVKLLRVVSQLLYVWSYGMDAVLAPWPLFVQRPLFHPSRPLAFDNC
jgi:hypothetical protein